MNTFVGKMRRVTRHKRASPEPSRKLTPATTIIDAFTTSHFIPNPYSECFRIPWISSYDWHGTIESDDVACQTDLAYRVL